MEIEDDGIDVRCPDCGFVMLPAELPSGGVVMRCRNCGQVHL